MANKTGDRTGKTKVEDLVEKFFDKMNGSTRATAKAWVQGAGLNQAQTTKAWMLISTDKKTVFAPEKTKTTDHRGGITKTKEKSQLETIAAKIGIATLETRNSDSLDFYNLAVWQIKEALQTAYLLGAAAGAVYSESNQ